MALVNKTKLHAPIGKFYDDKSVLITGGTGFLGKVLVEKLLYSCPNIDKIYLLVRKNKEMLAANRIKQMRTLPIFQRLQKERPDDLKKIVPVTGDLILPNLGICEEDERILIEKVSCVFHCAANIKFNQSLKIALHVNFEGTRNILQLSYRLKCIEVFVYVSTAYSNTDQPVLEEIIYPPPTSIEEVYKIIEQENINGPKTSKLLSCRPNTYTFVKALTETMINKENGKVPSVIIRPSIVSATLSEPLAGWVDHWFGATGLLTAIAKGANRFVLSKKTNILDLIPVDYVSNLIIVAAARANRSKDVLVYNSCSGAVNALTMEKIGLLTVEDSVKHNFCDILKPMIFFVQTKLLLTFLALIMETIPSFILDCWRRLFGKAPRYMKMRSQVIAIRDALQFFTSHSWIMKCSRTRELFASLSSSDKALFPFDPTHIVWSAYIPIYMNGIREYLLNRKARSEHISI